MKKTDKTEIYSDNKTTVYGSKRKRTKGTVHNLKAGDDIILNNKNCKIIEIISETTGEAVIYKIENNEKNIFALKLYFEFTDPAYEPNPEALSRIKELKDVDILQLYDYGTGINKYKAKYCFEIADFAHGADLLSIEKLKSKYTPDFIEKEVIPQIFLGILKLHENRIYHCDLKPQNVFFLDKKQKDIVVGDYGSAKTFEFDAEKSSRKTTTVKGTDFYLPPEQARGFISEKNDYYSFGMILLHLFYPEKILLNINKPKSLSHSKLKQIIERQFEAKPIIDFNPKYKRINRLIEGLTLVDFNLRWGKEQVEQWIEGKEINVVYIKPTDTKLRKDQALIFDGQSISTVFDLRDYILNDKNWYAELIEDTDNREKLTKWILNLYSGNRNKRSAFNRIIKQYSQEGIDFVADAVIRFFIPEHPVIFGLKSFDFAGSNDLKKTTARAFAHLILNLSDSSSDNDIRLYLFRYEFALRQLKDRQTEVSIVLKILYEKLSIKEKIRADFYNYKVYAYTSVLKKPLNKIKQFLFAYMPVKVNIVFAKFTQENTLHYKLEKSLTEYFAEIGINNVLTGDSYKPVSVNFPKIYNSVNKFYEKTINLIIESICIKHSVNKEMILQNSLELFKLNFENAYNKSSENLKKEYLTFKNELSENIKRHASVKKDLKKIESIISRNKYHLINSAYILIAKIEKYIEKIKKEREVQQLFKERQAIEAKNERRRPRREIIQIVVFVIAVIIFVILFAVLISFLERRTDKREKEENAVTTLKNSSENSQYSEMALIFVKGGAFEMGSDNEDNNAKIVHKVRLSNFYLSKYEITNEQFCKFLNEYGSEYIKEDGYSSEIMLSVKKSENIVKKSAGKWTVKTGYKKHPVNKVTWYGANEYCKWHGGSLPTEAQWEYAATGGAYSKDYIFSGSNAPKNVAWFDENSEDKIHEVGQKNPNEIGLYDMSGNLEEWAKDTYEGDYYNDSPEFNPYNDFESDKKTVRGSGIRSDLLDLTYIRSRYGFNGTYSKSYLGFRFCYNDSLKTLKND